jgi:hypothetical protein
MSAAGTFATFRLVHDVVAVRGKSGRSEDNALR